MRILIYALIGLFILFTGVTYVASQRAEANIESQSLKMQKEVDEVLQGFKDSRIKVCDGECPKG